MLQMLSCRDELDKPLVRSKLSLHGEIAPGFFILRGMHGIAGQIKAAP
jgi:hypothetical protein